MHGCADAALSQQTAYSRQNICIFFPPRDSVHRMGSEWDYIARNAIKMHASLDIKLDNPLQIAQIRRDQFAEPFRCCVSQPTSPIGTYAVCQADRDVTKVTKHIDSGVCGEFVSIVRQSLRPYRRKSHDFESLM